MGREPGNKTNIKINTEEIAAWYSSPATKRVMPNLSMQPWEGGENTNPTRTATKQPQTQHEASNIKNLEPWTTISQQRMSFRRAESRGGKTYDGTKAGLEKAEKMMVWHARTDDSRSTCFHQMRAPAIATPMLWTKSPKTWITAPLRLMLAACLSAFLACPEQ